MIKLIIQNIDIQIIERIANLEKKNIEIIDRIEFLKENKNIRQNEIILLVLFKSTKMKLFHFQKIKKKFFYGKLKIKYF